MKEGEGLYNQNGICPICKKGYLMATYDGNGDVVIETCTQCDLRREHKNRRGRTIPVEIDRRKK